MAQQTFPVGEIPRLTITNCSGDIEVRVWDEHVIGIETDAVIQAANPEGEGVIVSDISDNLLIHVPGNTDMLIEAVSGDVTIDGGQSLSLTSVHGDVEIKAMTEAVWLGDISGDVDIEEADSLTTQGRIEGDVNVSNVGAVEIEEVGGDLEINNVASLIVRSVHGDCEVGVVGDTFHYGEIGGGLAVRGAEQTVIVGGSVGGDCEVANAASVHIGSVGGDVEISHITDTVKLGSAGSDCEVVNVTGSVTVSNIGGDAKLQSLSGSWSVGTVGGDAILLGTFPPDSVSQATIGGDAEIELPDEPNVTIRATVDGDVSGAHFVSAPGDLSAIVYGEGSAQLDLMVGGDLELRGSSTPRSSSSSFAGWEQFGEEMGRMGEEIGRMGEEFGEEMGRMGEELGREMEALFGDWGKGKHKEWSTKADKWSARARKRAEERRREAEKRARRSQERAERVRQRMGERHQKTQERVRRSQERAERYGRGKSRVRFRVNDREWEFDPARLERIKEQARQAAQEGVSGAMAAVERAIAGMGVIPPNPPIPPTPPTPPTPPVPPMSSSSGEETELPHAATDATINLAMEQQTHVATPPVNIEEERAAILQMVAEGRISPEEGDMLLDALG
ncbi:MAG: hypothetical protein GFH27_549281n158 [Chloroflexi bacterium AL-W]|nr:hypothetical protein [Chloroflexi bacterium AL-N1]NOK66044.1 hypothetical protein [Chloroflexi bacterium AL-N10]NOK72925.1 hypothetical protein [Chloroflexi bacterium AL-N5]NOK79822.1 hypothetical protein [Chloroflexi bacterium AL-W]NOK88322.1 hypothetical protein [Chloroflexi bacterium AL-N15]